jgi:pilus assembly protein FimV
VEQHTGSQYDDDLTVGMDEYDSLQTGNVDLFEFVGDEESPITRLKTIILSIDWEISDDILRQFNIELLDLKDIWANDKINLVYVQALEKISKYIYQEKALSLIHI